MHSQPSFVLRSLASLTLIAFAPAALAQGTTAPTAPPTDPPKPAPAPSVAPDAPSAADPEPAPERAFVVMETSMGPIVLELDGKNAPLSVANFLRYTDKGHYDGTIFHRVIPTFMIQGGGFTVKGEQKPTDAPIKNEWTNGLKNGIGTIAFARTSNPDSATNQFFINVGDNSPLKDPAGVGYAVFGKVVAGMSSVNAIKSVKTGQRTLMARSGERLQAMPSRDVPLEVVEIKTVRRVTEDEAKAKIASMTNASGQSGGQPSGEAPKSAAPTTPRTPAAPPSGSTPAPPPTR